MSLNWQKSCTGSRLILLFPIFLLLLNFMMAPIDCQIGRDVAFQFLENDANADFLLSKQQLKSITNSLGVDSQLEYYSIKKFTDQIYPKYLLWEYDINKDKQLSPLQLTKLIKQKWSLYANSPNPSSLNLLSLSGYLPVCDLNKDGSLSETQFQGCLNAVLYLDYTQFQGKIKSFLYEDCWQGYGYEEFAKLLPKSVSQTGGDTVKEYTKKLFDNLEWDAEKIQGDQDDLIGCEEGKFFQGIMLMMYIDRNNDGWLSEGEMDYFYKKYGGKQIMDNNKDGKVDRNQFLSYYAFARCIGQQCQNQIKQQNNENKEEQATQQQKQLQTEQQQQMQSQQEQQMYQQQIYYQFELQPQQNPQGSQNQEQEQQL